MSTTEGIPAQAKSRDNARFVRPDGTPRDIVSVRLPATAAYLAVLRTTTASLAARLDFTLDEIEDLRIAVDEASSMLLTSATPGAELSSDFEMTDDTISVTLSTSTAHDRGPSRDSFAWTVLTALAGEVDSWTEPDGRQTISLVKHRGAEGEA